MNDTIFLLIGPLSAIVASAVFFWLVRIETEKSAALVEQMKADFHCQIEEQIRRLRPEVNSSALSLPDRLRKRHIQDNVA